MKRNQIVALLCSLGLILTALSNFFHTNITSSILLSIGCILVGAGVATFFTKPNRKTIDKK